MREITIFKNDAGQRLDRFLSKAVPGLPGPLAQKYIRTKRIKVNGKRSEQSYRLAEGDSIQLYVNEEFFVGDTPPCVPPSPVGAIINRPRAHTVRPYEGPPLSIVYEDDHILIVDKPPGLLSHSGNTPGEPTLADAVKAYLFQSGAWNPACEQTFVPALCNRLDRNTGGLVLAAKTAAALQTLNAKIRDREIDKYYLLAVNGRPKPPTGRIEGNLMKDSAQNRMTVTTQGDAKAAITEYRTLETKNDLSLVECKLITGRTHQIRAQMAALGCPLLGDRKYGGRGAAPHQALWAYRICFNFTSDAGVLDYLNGQEFLSKEPPGFFCRESGVQAFCSQNLTATKPP